MTDIVERLERMAATGIYPKEVREAASEVERLRADADHHLRAYQAMFNDNERLRADADHHLRAYQAMFNDNERLRAALAEYAKDENWKLNARFDPNSSRFDGTGFAHRALEPKP